ncbi:MAG: hypothetical protein ACRYF2_11175 [Janthinobacterium lividum]
MPSQNWGKGWPGALVAGLLLAGCSSRPAPIVLTPQAEPPSGIEGRYRGTARLIRSDNRYCPRSGPRVYELQNGAVTLSYQGSGRARIPLTAPIGPNGEFDTSDGQGRLQGSVTNGALSMTIASSACEHHWTMRLIN